MADDVREITGLDQMFDSIEVNGTVYETGRAGNTQNTVNLNGRSNTSAPRQTVQGQNVNGIDLNGVIHEIEDSVARQGDSATSEALAQEVQNRIYADNTLQSNITAIDNLIPAQATSENKLADKNFVNSSISTNTANFLGTYTTLADIEAIQNPTNNDYAFLETTDTAGNTLYKRYKYSGQTNEWLYEYDLNNSSFTAEQWDAINSGATAQEISSISGKIDADGSNATESGVDTMINKLSIENTDAVSTDYIIGQTAGGTDSDFHKKPLSSIWNYIKGKVAEIFAPKEIDTGINWSTVSWLGNATSEASLTDKYKCYAFDNATHIVNLQTSGTINGIYIYFDTAIKTCNIGTSDSAPYVAVAGAGIYVACENFTRKETVFTVTTNDDVVHELAVYYDDGYDEKGYFTTQREYRDIVVDKLSNYLSSTSYSGNTKVTRSIDGYLSNLDYILNNIYRPLKSSAFWVSDLTQYTNNWKKDAIRNYLNKKYDLNLSSTASTGWFPVNARSAGGTTIVALSITANSTSPTVSNGHCYALGMGGYGDGFSGSVSSVFNLGQITTALYFYN